ncbi:MAG TPA: tetratricopeptide repeat protein, partial [Burkholderiaceae bacterium]
TTQRMRRQGHLALVLLLGSTACLQLATAGVPPNVTAGEMAALPVYCPDTMGFKYGDAYSNTSPRAKHWVGMMGPGFWAMHHYCWALLSEGRARAPAITTEQRRFLYESAIADATYVVLNTKPDFILLPEILVRIGEWQLKINRIPQAYDAFMQARTAKPDYWPAYSKWAELQISQKLLSQARKTLEEGLAQAPDASELIRLYRSVGGDPAPFVAAAAASAAAVAAAAAQAERAASAGSAPQ